MNCECTARNLNLLLSISWNNRHEQWKYRNGREEGGNKISFTDHEVEVEGSFEAFVRECRTFKVACANTTFGLQFSFCWAFDNVACFFFKSCKLWELFFEKSKQFDMLILRACISKVLGCFLWFVLGEQKYLFLSCHCLVWHKSTWSQNCDPSLVSVALGL